MNEIALENNLKYMRRLGGPESKAVLIGYPKGTVLPDNLNVDGFRISDTRLKPSYLDRCAAITVRRSHTINPTATAMQSAVHAVRHTAGTSVLSKNHQNVQTVLGLIAQSTDNALNM